MLNDMKFFSLSGSRIALKKLDWILIGAVMILCAISLLTLYSVNYGKPSFFYFTKQAAFIFLGLALMFVFSFFDFRLFKNQPYFLIFLYIIGLLLLVGVLLMPAPIRGARSWFQIGVLSFEPVEAIKLILILILAKYFSSRHIEMYRARHIIASGLYVFLPAILVLAQPDLGSFMVLAFIWLGIILLAGIRPRHLIIVLLGAAMVFILAWFGALKTYQKERLLTFVNPQRDPAGASYNLIQSKIAIGSGGLWGKGLGRGTQGRLDFLPEKNADFIFAAFAEEWGFFGVLFLLATYAVIFFRLIKIALKADNNFFRICASGICLLFFSQVFINIGVALGILQITGLSLPFVSYGGSGLLVNFATLGIAQSIIREINNTI